MSSSGSVIELTEEPSSSKHESKRHRESRSSYERKLTEPDQRFVINVRNNKKLEKCNRYVLTIK